MTMGCVQAIMRTHSHRILATASALAASVAIIGTSAACSRSRTDDTKANLELCDPAAKLDRLDVRRDAGPNLNHLQFPIPATTTVTDATAVRTVATALCTLPLTPEGTFSCPADFGVVQHLTFWIAARPLPDVAVQASGCHDITGVGPLRRGTTPVWNALGAALHLAAPYDESFSGTLPPPTATTSP